MKIAITGHRPQKLNNEWDGKGPMSDWLRQEIKKELDKHSISQLISGMALGVDMLFAEIAIERQLDLLAAIPCKSQPMKWPPKSQDRWNKILKYKKCEQVCISRFYAPWVMQERNKYMVDNCDLLIACWDGTVGGTGNCVRYANKVKKEIVRIDPQEFYEA